MKEKVFPPGIEPGTFRVLGGCDNHYTTETAAKEISSNDNTYESSFWHWLKILPDNKWYFEWEWNVHEQRK